VSEAVTVPHSVEPAESPLTPESWGKLGMWVFLVGDAMSFGGLLAAYAAYRVSSPDWPVPSKELGIGLTAFMTFLLICSSVTMVKALSAIRHGSRTRLVGFLLLTALGGAIFLGCQAYEWTHLMAHGASFTGHLFWTTFFTLTGFHGMHVFSGVVYLLVMAGLSARGKFTQESHNEIEITGLYWHFVDLVWILIFTFVYLI
jgi:heme/copper-type cytochrome/quinol oxidase subunit 3